MPSAPPRGPDRSPGPTRLAERSGGNPLFAEALVDALAEGDSETDEPPATVRELLAARLDSLGSFERALLGHAAVVGPSFSTVTLEGLAQAAGADLAESLGELRRKNLITPEAAEFPDAPGTSPSGTC